MDFSGLHMSFTLPCKLLQGRLIAGKQHRIASRLRRLSAEQHRSLSLSTPEKPHPLGRTSGTRRKCEISGQFRLVTRARPL